MSPQLLSYESNMPFFPCRHITWHMFFKFFKRKYLLRSRLNQSTDEFLITMFQYISFNHRFLSISLNLQTYRLIEHFLPPFQYINSLSQFELNFELMDIRLLYSGEKKKHTSRFNYHTNLELAPNENHSEVFDHQQSNFTFQHSASKGKFKDVSLFDDYRDDVSQTIAKNLIEENVVLKEEIRKSQHLMKQLELELNNCRSQIQLLRRSRENEKEGIIQQLKSEIILILQKNKLVQEQLNIIRTFLPSISKTNQFALNSNENAREERYRSSSLDFKKNKRMRQEIKESDYHKTDELMESIKTMHLKIMGFQTDSLKELWRWLKGMGYTYSYLKKYKQKFQEILISKEFHRQKLLYMLKELISTLDS